MGSWGTKDALEQTTQSGEDGSIVDVAGRGSVRAPLWKSS